MQAWYQRAGSLTKANQANVHFRSEGPLHADAVVLHVRRKGYVHACHSQYKHMSNLLAVYRSDRTGPATVSLNGLGKRPQECEDVYGEAQNQNYKRTRMGGGLAAEYLGDAAEPPRGQEGHAMRRREPIELFPERNGDLYVEVPAYGTFR